MAEQFVAGVRHHLPALAAITAPSAVSYYRLRPNRWAPTWANVAARDRGASIRVCPIYGRDDAARAIQHRIPRRRCRREPVSGARRGDLGRGRRNPQRALVAARARAQLLGDERGRTRGGRRTPLPRSLEEALGHLEASEAAREWFGETFFRAYLMFKRAELRAIEGLTEAEICARYAEVY